MFVVFAESCSLPQPIKIVVIKRNVVKRIFFMAKLLSVSDIGFYETEIYLSFLIRLTLNHRSEICFAVPSSTTLSKAA